MKKSYTDIQLQQGWYEQENKDYKEIVEILAEKTKRDFEEVRQELYFIESQVENKKYDGDIFGVPLKIREYPQKPYHSSQKSVTKKVFTI